MSSASGSKVICRNMFTVVVTITACVKLKQNPYKTMISYNYCICIGVMIQLKRANADTKTSSTVYVTVIRRVLEYPCQVWHFSIVGYLSDDIERVQRSALTIKAVGR